MFSLLAEILNLVLAIIAFAMLGAMSLVIITLGVILCAGLYLGWSAVKATITRFSDLYGVTWSEAEVPVLGSTEQEALDDLQGNLYFEGTEYRIKIAGTVQTVFIPGEHAIRSWLKVRFAFGRSGKMYIRPLRA